jgi:ankyrin repeat protein
MQRPLYAGDAAVKDSYSAFLELPYPPNCRLPTPAEVAKYPTFMPAIPLEQNAARFYLKAVLFKASEDQPIPDSAEDISGSYNGDIAALQSWVDSNRTALTAVRNAMDAGAAEYPMLMDAKTDELVVAVMLGALRDLARICADAGFLEELRADPDAAAEWYIACVRMGAQNRTGLVVNNLVSCAISSLGWQRLGAIIANAPLSDVTLREAIAACRAAESTPEQLRDTLKRESELLEARMAEPGGPASALDRRLAAQQSQALQRLSNRIDIPLPQFLATDQDRAQAENDRSEYSRWRIQLGRMDIGLRATEVRAAIMLYQRKNGKLPETLDTLCPDFLPEVPLGPFSGKPVRYAKTEQGWKVWSEGEDMKDDGGNADYSQQLGTSWGPHYVILSGTQSALERRSGTFMSLSLKEGEKALAARKSPVPSELRDAVRKNDKALVEKLLAAGADSNAKDWEGRTPLHLAVIGGHVELVGFLLTKGADLAAGDNCLRLTPLHYATNLAGPEIIRILLENGAAVNAKGARDQTPLHLACTREAVDLLLAKKADVNALDNQGYTPLHWASASGRLAVAEQLIKGGADVNAKDKNGFTPLHLAAAAGEVELAKLLLASGAQPDARTTKGITPVIAACSSYRNKAMLDFLISKGVAPNDELYVAITGKDLELAKAALAPGAKPGGVNALRVTPLGEAVLIEAGKPIVELLLDKGADVNETDEFLGDTPLSYAVSLDRPKDIITLLLARGAKPNVVDKYGGTPLRSAVDWNRLDLVELLLAKGADVNVKDKAGSTPLHLAVEKGFDEVAKFLREHGGKE